MAANNVPAPLPEKYLRKRAHCIELGKEFYSEKEKRVLLSMWQETNHLLPHEVPNDLDAYKDEFIPMSPERARAIRMDETEARKEADDANKLVRLATLNSTAEKQEIGLLREQNKDMAAQLARMEEWKAQIEAERAVPQSDWTRRDI